MRNHLIDVSVIVTTKNDEVNIQHCLESVKKQDYPLHKIELIVVDNNSTDRTLNRSTRFTDKIFNKGPDRGAQRNLGVKHSAGKYILYLEADMRLSAKVIKECVYKCESSNDIALYIPERSMGKGFGSRLSNFMRSFYDGTCIDSARFVRRDKFLEIGGFDEDLTGGQEWDLDRRIKAIGMTGIIDSPAYRDKLKPEVDIYASPEIKCPISFEKYKNKWGRNDPIIRKQFGLFYRFCGVFFENGKWKRLVIYPLLVCGAFLLWFLIRK